MTDWTMTDYLKEEKKKNRRLVYVFEWYVDTILGAAVLQSQYRKDEDRLP